MVARGQIIIIFLSNENIFTIEQYVNDRVWLENRKIRELLNIGYKVRVMADFYRGRFEALGKHT